MNPIAEELGNNQIEVKEGNMHTIFKHCDDLVASEKLKITNVKRSLLVMTILYAVLSFTVIISGKLNLWIPWVLWAVVESLKMFVLVYAVLAMRKAAVKIETVQPDDKYVRVHIINFVVIVTWIIYLFIISAFIDYDKKEADQEPEDSTDRLKLQLLALKL